MSFIDDDEEMSQADEIAGDAATDSGKEKDEEDSDKDTDDED